MQGVDIGNTGPRQKKGMGHKRPKRRAGIRIDMTPMVDIAFLLLIFYMVTAVFNQPQALQVNLPPTKEKVKVKESLLLTLRIDSDEKLWWNIGRETPEPIPFDSLRGLLLAWNLKQDSLMTLLEVDKDARYFTMIDVVDEIQIVEKWIKQKKPNFSYRFSLSLSSVIDKGDKRGVQAGASP